jgi:hypothetical protein
MRHVKFMLGAAVVSVGLLAPAAAASAAPPSAASAHAPDIVSVQLAPQDQRSWFAWVYKGFYRNLWDCEYRANWYHQRGVSAECRPVIPEGADRPFGYNIFVRAQFFGDV